MQVILSANMSNPAGETNAKSAEIAEAGAANDFFVQMGQILDQGNENNKAQADPAPSVSASNSAEKNARRLLQCPSTGKRIAIGIADRDSMKETHRDIKGVGLNSEEHAEHPTKATGDAIQNFLMLDLQKENAPQQGWSIPLEAAGTVNDLVVSRNSMRQIEDLRAYLQAGLENAPQSVSGHARAGNITDMREGPQDQALSAQLNFDFIAAGTFASRQGMPVPPTGIDESQDLSFTDNLALSENARLQIDDSPVTILKKSLKTMPASLENSDTATAAAARGQTVDKERPWIPIQGKLEQGQLHSGQQQFSAAERQPQTQFVFASSPAQHGELAGSVSAPPAQTSTSHGPELYFQLADQIRIQLRDGKGEIRIQLKPDSLGRLEIRAENTAHGVSARISTDSGAVKSYLENNLQLLQQTLQDQGLKIDRIHIVVQDAFDLQSSSDYTAQFGHAGSGQNGKEPPLSSGKSSASRMNPIDETGLDLGSWLALNPGSSFYTVA